MNGRRPFDLAKRSFTFEDDGEGAEEAPEEEELISTISFSKSRIEKEADSSLVRAGPETGLDDDVAGGTEPPIAISETGRRGRRYAGEMQMEDIKRGDRERRGRRSLGIPSNGLF